MRIIRRPHPILNYLLIAVMAILAALVLMLLAPTPAHGQAASQPLPLHALHAALHHAELYHPALSSAASPNQA
jgi:hypothetical protein